MYHKFLIQDTRDHYESTKRALDAYLAVVNNPNPNMPKRGRYPDEQPTSIAVAVRKAVLLFDPRRIFTAEDVFAEISNDNADYTKSRSSISATLSKLVAEGRIEKMTRRGFRRIVQAEEAVREGGLIPNENGLF